jgi:serine phosphatase RsbU (regulator of sigma subunit)
MATLITMRGPDPGRQFSLKNGRTTLGRQADCAVSLASKQVSRQHAEIVFRDGQHFLEDLGSSNGTYLNGQRLSPRTPMPLTERDMIQIGPYVFGLKPGSGSTTAQIDPPLIVRETLSAVNVPPSVLAQDAATKLQVVLEISQHLARTLDLDPLLDKLLEHLMHLFPQADRALVILCEGDRLALRAQRAGPSATASYPFSRTIVRRALDEGVGLLSEDVHKDSRFTTSTTITALDLHSVMVVPLINTEGRRLGALQVDRHCIGLGFRLEDLHLLTAIGMQVSVVLENVALHAERLREERLLQELALAREIQQSYLPDELDDLPEGKCEIFGQVFPARQVAGDFYDFFMVPSGKLCFFIGDVSGKGMPAALFLVAVRTLCRHLAKEMDSPARLLGRLNEALAADNPSCMFVTLVQGIYDPPTGAVTLASAGHPPPLVRRAIGRVETLALRPGRLLGYPGDDLHHREMRIELAAGDTLVLYTDGLLEARAPDDRTMFGPERAVELAQLFSPDRPLADCAEQAKQTVDRFTAAEELQDDLTLLLLRRTP